MENYRILYSIIIEHDYFNDKPCNVLQCRLSPQSEQLALQRGLLFKQMAPNEWAVLVDSIGTGHDTASDVLELNLQITDPNFPLYTDWNGLQLSVAHELELPGAQEKLDAASVIHRSCEMQDIAKPFCTIRLKLTQELLDAAMANKPKKTQLHFSAPKMQWEIIFLPRSENSFSQTNKLLLEDAKGKIKFTPIDEIEVLGRRVRRTLSTKRIPMRKVYNFHLQLMAQNGGNGYKRLLPIQVTPPEPGRFKSSEEGVLRQICHY